MNKREKYKCITHFMESYPGSPEIPAIEGIEHIFDRDPEATTTATTFFKNGNVKSIHRYCRGRHEDIDFDEDGKEILHTNRQDFHINEGKALNYIEEDSAGNTFETKPEYDENNTSARRLYNQNGKVTDRLENIYDNNGVLKEQHIYSGDDVLRSVTKFENSETMNIVSVFSPDGNVLSKLIKPINNATVFIRENYDEKGGLQNITDAKSFVLNTSTIKDIQSTEEMDGEYNLIEKTEFINFANGTTKESRIYNAQGQMIENCITERSLATSELTKCITTFYSDGKPNKEIKRWFEYIYP